MNENSVKEEYSKLELRKNMSKLRDKLLKEDKEQYDYEIFSKLTSDTLYIDSKVLFIYVSFKNEVGTHKIIIDALKRGKTVCVPKVISKKEGMRAIIIKSFSDLKEGKFGILEPEKEEPFVNPQDIDLCIVPGLAFDLNGGRLGYGGGFYDRFLSKASSKTFKLALAYDFQVINEVPTKEHDIKIDRIITN